VEDSPDENDQRIVSGGVWSGISDGIEEIRSYIEMTGATKILRRYFAMNAFDGSMTSLGVVIGAYLSHIHEPRSVMGVVVTSGIAMMVSGFSGTYMAESAERSRSLNELEDAMLINLDDTMYGRASRFVSLFAALVDGSAPFLAAVPSLLPFLFVPGILSIETAYLVSVGASLATLFALGIFLGRISGENILLNGIKMVVAGIAVALIALALNLH